jgi:hypothetical protein
MSEKTNARMDTRGDSSDIRTAAQGDGDSGAAQHTPGPWEVDSGGIQEFHVGSDGVGVPVVPIYKQDGYLSHPVAWVHPYLYLGDPTADAHLIAAAPELLAALKALLENDAVNVWVGGNPNVINAVVEQGLAAIAKAEGR